MNTSTLQAATEKLLGKPTQVYSFHHTGGGEINQSYKVLTDVGVYYVKVHPSKPFPRLFDREISSLKTLRQANEIDVILPLAQVHVDGHDFLFLDFVFRQTALR